jgi:hypothetical protein
MSLGSLRDFQGVELCNRADEPIPKPDGPAAFAWVMAA